MFYYEKGSIYYVGKEAGSDYTHILMNIIKMEIYDVSIGVASIELSFMFL